MSENKRKEHALYINNLYIMRDKYKNFSKEWVHYENKITESKIRYYNIYVKP